MGSWWSVSIPMHMLDGEIGATFVNIFNNFCGGCSLAVGLGLKTTSLFFSLMEVASPNSSFSASSEKAQEVPLAGF